MSIEQPQKKERVIAYIDGYNLFFGLVEGDFERFLWLNVQQLVESILNPNQDLKEVKYFTALITNDPAKRARQKTYIEALQTLDKVKVIFGKFKSDNKDCKKCGNSYVSYNEKMTDVNIATHIMSDYYEENFDMAMVISGDTDLLPPIKMINENGKNKRVFVAFPPKRVNDEVRRFAKGDAVIGRKNLKDSQLPLKIINKFGGTIEKPTLWS